MCGGGWCNSELGVGDEFGKGFVYGFLVKIREVEMFEQRLRV